MFLGRDPNDTTFDWKEWHLQAYVVMKSRQSNIIVHGDQNGASKTPKGWSQAAATGMLKGWPDLCFILDHGPLWIELKLGKGRLSKEQIELHGIMKEAGCRVETVASNTPAECWDKVKEIIAPTEEMRYGVNETGILLLRDGLPKCPESGVNGVTR